MSFLRNGSFQRRGMAALAVGLLLVGGLVLVFAGSLTRSVDVGDEAEQALAEIAELTARVETGRAEIDYLDTEEFVDQVARSVGLGARGEKPFALPADAPSPAPVVPLGSLRDDSADQAAFEAWMDLLFGA